MEIVLLTAQPDRLEALSPMPGLEEQAYRHQDSKPGGDNLMRELQANILHPHGRNHAVLLFLRFHTGCSEARQWLRWYASHHLTTAWHEARGERPMMVHIALSAEGYRALEIDPDLWPSPVERPGSPSGPDVFRMGLQHRAQQLGEPVGEQWDPAFLGGVHMLIVAASNEPMQLIRAEWQLLAATRGIASIVAIERAFDLRDRTTQDVAPACEVEPETPCLQSDFTPADAIAQLLAPDPAGTHRLSYGSYFVFRKLEYDLRASRTAWDHLAQRFGIGPESSTALANSVRQSQGPPVWRTVARRCVAYGGQMESGSGHLPSRGQGLLFMCYQSNIREQFEAVQRWWSDNQNGGSPDVQSLSAACSGFSQHVTLRGGEYLFSPSASFFLNLAD